jgi:3-oxoadipate enol-lactonase
MNQDPLAAKTSTAQLDGSEELPGGAVVGGARISFEDNGDGPALVLLHCGTCDSRIWEQQVRTLAISYRVVRYDIRPCGRSDPPTGPFSQIDDLAALLEELQIERAVLVGLSMGGVIALDYDFRFPNRVLGLVLIASGLRGHDWSNDPVLRAAAAPDPSASAEDQVDLFMSAWANLGSDQDVTEFVREMVRHNLPSEGLPREWRIVPDEPTAQRLCEVRSPTLVVVGDSDQPDILRIADRLQREIPEARKVRRPR